METITEKKTKITKIGFIGTGWIGRNRMNALVNDPVVQPIAIVDKDDCQAAEALKLFPNSNRYLSLQEMLDIQPDAVVIATPSALHAEQSILALKNGCSVFCQKPLARNALECASVIESARYYNLLLSVDMSYRFLDGVRIAREIIRNNGIGEIFSIDCCFHNAYGPDKEWFYDFKYSGGGCMIDLGIHLIDLSLWVLNFPNFQNVSSARYSKGKRINSKKQLEVEDFAEARIELDTGTAIRLACSWKISAGCDAVISWTFYGSKGTICIKNVNGSFYDFITEQYNGTTRVVIHNQKQNWGELAIKEWAKRLRDNNCFDKSIEEHLVISSIIDSIYMS
jgi:predicted dehydrogenase